MNTNTKLDDYIVEFKNIMPSLTIDKTFFFDESNNIKKGIIGLEKDNNKDLENLYFVLGGIAIEGTLDFNALLHYVGARQAPVDAKFSFFSFKKTKFEEAINQPRLRKFFEYLLKNKMLIHFDVLHYFHFAMTDILDSLIEENDANQYAAFSFYQQLQSDMTEVLYQDFESLHNVLVHYEFPNIPKPKANAFICEILNLYTNNLTKYNSNNPEYFTKELLRQIIKAKRNKGRLIFLEDNVPFAISETVFPVYISRMIEISDKKYFDNEASITAQLEECDSNYTHKLNADFVDSFNYREIQICDAICGFVARLYNFLSHNDKSSIITFVKTMNNNDESYKTLKAFYDLMTMSNSISPILFKKTTPRFIEERFSLLFSLIESGR